MPRYAYLDGTLEVLHPGRTHERTKSILGRLLEMWGEAKGVELAACGSLTLCDAPKQAGVEPDECYFVGDEAREIPDLAIEVVDLAGYCECARMAKQSDAVRAWRGRLVA